MPAEFRFLKRTEIDDLEWDRCVSTYSNGVPYAYTWYLDAITPGWCALVAGAYESLFPIPVKRKYGIRYAVTPPFMQQLGLLGKNERIEEAIQLIQKHIAYAYLSLHHQNCLPKILSTIKVSTQTNLVIPASEGYKEWKNGYNQNTIRNLKKADGELKICENPGVSRVIDLFRENRGKNLSVMQPGHYQSLERLVMAGQNRKEIVVFGVENALDEVLAGAVVYANDKRAVFLFSGLSLEGKEKGAMFFLIDYLLKHFWQPGRCFDFEGSNDPSLARFYRGFGAVEENYFHIRYNLLPWPINKLARI